MAPSCGTDCGYRRGGAGRGGAAIRQFTADPNGTALQRLQSDQRVPGKGEHRERVYDVACSDGLEVNPATGRCPDNGAGVDLRDCSTALAIGASELKALWRDPEFDPGQERAWSSPIWYHPE